MANTTIKITQLQNIGNGLASNTLLPVVNTTGTAITQKVTVGNVANFIMGQAGNSLAPAFLSTLAYNVVNAAQPNITSVGTLNVNTLKISGGVNGYVLQTDGTGNIAWVSGGGSGNGEVGGSSGQIQFNDSGDFGGDSSLTWDQANTLLGTVNFAASHATIYGNVDAINVNATGNLVPNAIYTDHYYYANGYIFGGGGGNGAPGGTDTQIQFNDNGVFSGNAGFTFDKITGTISSPFLVGNGNGLSNIQGASISGAVATATYATNIAGANVTGAVTYAATANSVAVANVVGIGNIATLSLDGSTSNVLYGNGVFAPVSSGANTGNVTFDDVAVQGVNQLKLSAGADFTANLAYLQVRAGDVASHIHFDTGNNEAYDLIVGNDQKFVQVSSTGNIIMSSYDSANSTSYVWTLDTTGNLILPGNAVAINFANGSTAFSNLVQWTTAPVANTSTGSVGEAAYDSGGNLYVCVLTNTWAKFAGTTSW